MQIAMSRSLKIAEMRQKWINDLRDEMAGYLSLAAINAYVETDQSEKAFAHVSKIQLLLNPDDSDYEELNGCMGNLASKLYEKDSDLTAEREFSAICQRILKKEWDRLKNDLKKARG